MLSSFLKSSKNLLPVAAEILASTADTPDVFQLEYGGSLNNEDFLKPTANRVLQEDRDPVAISHEDPLQSHWENSGRLAGPEGPQDWRTPLFIGIRLLANRDHQSFLFEAQGQAAHRAFLKCSKFGGWKCKVWGVQIQGALHQDQIRAFTAAVDTDFIS